MEPGPKMGRQNAKKAAKGAMKQSVQVCGKGVGEVDRLMVGMREEQVWRQALLENAAKQKAKDLPGGTSLANRFELDCPMCGAESMWKCVCKEIDLEAEGELVEAFKKLKAKDNEPQPTKDLPANEEECKETWAFLGKASFTGTQALEHCEVCLCLDCVCGAKPSKVFVWKDLLPITPAKNNTSKLKGCTHSVGIDRYRFKPTVSFKGRALVMESPGK